MTIIRLPLDRRLLATIVVVITVVVAFHPGLSRVTAQNETRVVEGVIFNGSSEDARDTAGLTITLHRIGVSGSDDVHTISGAHGIFRFKDILYDPGLKYGVSVRYQGTIYGTDINLADGSPEPLTIIVFDATSDERVIKTTSASLLLASVNRTTQTIHTLEIVRISNDSDFTYVPGPQPMQLLRFGLPKGATNLQVDTILIGADFTQVDLGFALFASIPPGEHEIMFSYEFPYTSESYILEKTYRYGAESVRVLAPSGLISITSDSLGSVDTVMIGERSYQIIESEHVERGGEIIIHLDHLQSLPPRERIIHQFTKIKFNYVIPSALLALMFALLIYGGFWKRSKSLTDVTTVHENEHTERETIHKMINELEESFDSGRLDEVNYRRRLSILNSQLTHIRNSSAPPHRSDL